MRRERHACISSGDACFALDSARIVAQDLLQIDLLGDDFLKSFCTGLLAVRSSDLCTHVLISKIFGSFAEIFGTRSDHAWAVQKTGTD